jgi:hypothetical protein
MAAAATQLTSQPLRETDNAIAWCSFLLQHLDALSTLTWYLVADGLLVERVLLNSLHRLTVVAFDPSIPLASYKRARDIVIAESLGALGKQQNSRRHRQPVPQEFIPPDLIKLAAILEDSLFLSTQHCEAPQ